MGGCGDGTTIREAGFGDASFLSFLHAKVYGRQYGFRSIFENYVMKGMAEYLGNPAGGRMWVAEMDGTIVGGIAVVRVDAATAQLRWFVIDDACQGKGLGKELFGAALEFCRSQGYAKAFLWTIDILGAARHLYEKFGFAITERKPNTEWTGAEMLEERWDIAL